MAPPLRNRAQRERCPMHFLTGSACTPFARYFLKIVMRLDCLSRRGRRRTAYKKTKPPRVLW